MKGLTPERKRLLQLYVQCCKRSASRIVRASRWANGGLFGPCDTVDHGKLVLHMAACMRAGRMREFTEARMRLQIAQSRFECELQGREYSA